MKKRVIFLLAVTLGAISACGPDMNAVANRLRAEKMEQERQIATLQQQVANRDAQIRDLQGQLRGGMTPLNTLPPERLEQLFTAARMEFRGQTDIEDLGAGQKGFRVFLRLFDDAGQMVSSTGELTIEVFELPASPAEPRRLGTWKFTPQEMKRNWYTGLGANHFAFSCPFQTTPSPGAGEFTFKARFRDALTGSTIDATLTKKISQAATTQGGM